jgi:hypothetical protein
MTEKATNSPVELPNTAGDNNVPPDNVGGGAATPPPTSPSDDPFDLRNLRIDQTFLTGSAEKLISSFSVRKPKKNSFFRVHPGEDYQATTYIYQEEDEGGMEKETYLVYQVCGSYSSVGSAAG